MKNKQGKLSLKGVALVNLVRIAALACLLLSGYGIIKTVMYAAPMAQADYRSASQSPIGDTTLIIYGEAVRVFEVHGEAKYSARLLKEAYNDLTRESGLVPENKREIASRIQHMLGVVNEAMEDYRVAISAYEESLKANPDNMESKYNLERLKKQYPDLGKAKPDQEGGTRPGDKQKGI